MPRDMGGDRRHVRGRQAPHGCHLRSRLYKSNMSFFICVIQRIYNFLGQINARNAVQLRNAHHISSQLLCTYNIFNITECGTIDGAGLLFVVLFLVISGGRLSVTDAEGPSLASSAQVNAKAWKVTRVYFCVASWCCLARWMYFIESVLLDII